MKEKSNIRILIHSVYMILFYSLVGICVSTAVSYYSVEMYQKHYILCTFFAALITIPFCLRQMKRDGFLAREKQFLRENISVSNFLAIVILSISACVALNYWIKMLGLMELFHGYDRVEKLIYGNSLLEEFLAVVLAAPIVEELLFRGLVFGNFKKLWNCRGAMLASALLFGLYHGNMLQFIYAFSIGLLLVYVYEVFGTICAPILSHIVANGASVLMTECLDMSWVKGGMMFLFTLAFTLTGMLSLVWIARKRKRKLDK